MTLRGYLVWCGICLPILAWGQEGGGLEQDLVSLPIEQLLTTEVSSVLKHPSELADAPAATTVLRREDIERMAATSLPDLLRLVPGLHVAQLDGNRWAVSSRGMNGFFGSKLLVMVDGRSIYNSVYSGVFWDANDIPLDNIARIEIIRGPGAALWGVNAVNGVINIVTRTAQETTGGLASVSLGNVERGKLGLRWGQTNEDGSAWRVYSQSHHRDQTRYLTGSLNGSNRPGDDSRSDRVGFRADSAPGSTTWMVTGEGYSGYSGGAPMPLATSDDIRGHHLQGRVTRLLEDGSLVQMQGYLAYSWRQEAAIGSVLEENVADFDLQRSQELNPFHRLTWGGGVRQYHFDSIGSSKLAFDPDSSTANVINLFLQDEWQFRPSLRLIAGAKVEHVPQSGTQFQPNLRLVWTPAAGHTLWAGTARAVRAGNQVDRNIRYGGQGISAVPVQGNPDFGSETLISQEGGWRAQLSPTLASDLSLYRNRYADLETIDYDPSQLSMSYYNHARGTTHGLEWALDWQAADNWQLRSGLTLYHESLEYSQTPQQPSLISFKGGFPTRQAFVRSLWDISARQRFDLTWRGAGPMPARGVPGYGTFDFRWSYRMDRRTEVALTGRNLTGPEHEEFARQPFFQQTAMRRELMVSLSREF